MDCSNQLAQFKAASNFSALIANCTASWPVNDDCTLPAGHETSFPSAPSDETWIYEQVPDPTYSPASRRRRELLRASFAAPTAAPGQTWNVTVVMSYNAISQTWVTTYIASANAIVNGQQTVITNVLSFSQLGLVSVSMEYVEAAVEV